MVVTITGAAGFLGRRVATSLAARGHKLILSDLVAPADPPAGAEIVVGDLASTLPSIITEETTAVISLAAVVSAGAEADFDLGYRVNLDSLRQQLERCRAEGSQPKFIFASSIAAFGGVQDVNDHTAVSPLSSYGHQKAIGELLVSDYARRGFVDGRTLRLPTVCVRPDVNAAASAFASAILREPLRGQPAVCPVGADFGIWVSSPSSVVRSILHAYELPSGSLGHRRTVNLPGISVTVGEMLEALGRAGGDASLVNFEHDSALEAILGTWPVRFETPRAAELGFPPSADLDAMIREHLDERSAAPNGRAHSYDCTHDS